MIIKNGDVVEVKKIDPLGITDLRVRGMWYIENPIKVFQNVASIKNNSSFTMRAILLQEKYFSFPKKDREELEALQNQYFTIQDIHIPPPNNPAKLLEAKLITYEK